MYMTMTKTISINISASRQSTCWETLQQVVSKPLVELFRLKPLDKPWMWQRLCCISIGFRNTFITVYGLHPSRIIQSRRRNFSLVLTWVKHFRSTGFFHSSTFLSLVPLSHRFTCRETSFPINHIGSWIHSLSNVEQCNGKSLHIMVRINRRVYFPYYKILGYLK